MKNRNAKGLFDEAMRLEKLTKQGDSLVLLKEKIQWEQFRTILESVLKKESKGPGGRKAFDYIMMFKILILQRYYNLSDDQMEYQILDRMTFMRFLDLELSDKVPDSKTIWLFKETLTKAKVVEKLFEKFHNELEEQGYIVNEGKIIDASFVEVPRQRNSREENKEIKEGNIPQDWQEKPHKLSQKDIDAKWTKKNDDTFYGYKDHVKTDKKSKLIDKYKVTDASVHDSQPLYELLEEKDAEQPLHADSAYTGEEQEKTIKDKRLINCVNEKGYRNKPLTEQQKAKNKEKSRIRARVEHVFGFIENSMHSSFIRTIGIARATATIGLMNLTYNLFRYIQLQKVVYMR
jgi:transposase, IS5 family